MEESTMSEWHCLHMDDTLTAMVTSDGRRFLVHLREPPGEHRRPVEFHRWTLADALGAADRLVQAYYPHDCGEYGCGEWQKL
jgi:hypothetical protein